MHLYMISRGNNLATESWKTFMQGQMFPWKREVIAIVGTCKSCKKEFLLQNEKTNMIEKACPHCQSMDFTTEERRQEHLTYVQGSLRPFLLWEYVFPEESLDDVLTALGCHKPGEKYEDKELVAKMVTKGIRTAIGAKPVPKYKQDVKRVIPRVGVALNLIGIKKDDRRDFNQWGVNQEAL